MGRDSAGFIAPDQELSYLIRFQNTGNDTAFHVSIRDILDKNLDKSSFRFIASSHTVNLTLNNNGELVFDFPNINLVDSNANEPESHGFVKYKISPKNNLPPNTTIENTANIYFDNNPAIVTNTVVNTIECYGLTKPTINGISSTVLGTTNSGNFNYQWYLNGNLLPGRVNDTIQPQQSGQYTVEVTDSNACSILSDPYTYFAVGLEAINLVDAKLYPNPFEEELNIEFANPLKEEIILTVYTIQGQRVQEKISSSKSRMTLHKANLAEGTYFLTIRYSSTKEVIVRELIMVK